MKAIRASVTVVEDVPPLAEEKVFWSSQLFKAKTLPAANQLSSPSFVCPVPDDDRLGRSNKVDFRWMMGRCYDYLMRTVGPHRYTTPAKWRQTLWNAGEKITMVHVYTVGRKLSLRLPLKPQ